MRAAFIALIGAAGFTFGAGLASRDWTAAAISVVATMIGLAILECLEGDA